MLGFRSHLTPGSVFLHPPVAKQASKGKRHAWTSLLIEVEHVCMSYLILRNRSYISQLKLFHQLSTEMRWVMILRNLEMVAHTLWGERSLATQEEMLVCY